MRIKDARPQGNIVTPKKSPELDSRSLLAATSTASQRHLHSGMAVGHALLVLGLPIIASLEPDGAERATARTHRKPGHTQRKLFLFLAASSNSRVPSVSLPPHLGVNVSRHVLISEQRKEAGTCTTEAAPYLKAIHDHYDEIADHDVAFFMHAHSTSWHAPVPMQQRLTEIMRSEYSMETFGAVYCFWNSNWAAMSLAKNKLTRQEVWSIAFRGTNWDSNAPSDWDAMNYPCCATFFVQGWSLRRHPKSHYRIVHHNLVSACKNASSGLFQPGDKTPGPGGRIMEGSWHIMLGNTHSVARPPDCPGPRPSAPKNHQTASRRRQGRRSA